MDWIVVSIVQDSTCFYTNCAAVAWVGKPQGIADLYYSKIYNKCQYKIHWNRWV